ncbi:uncharacterized protein LOC106769786 isoform X2 [Vigna radiata var. radiata]|uniref:Uncharacterized protein LOC106769786 isoform X2 n=1 Tax=Vigna radiata var. radiata TaxID=3916 RepID=A0A3Q0FBK4_VIGRR|nr:uncharacterized protein LOC106769786 isoform X2 [Vigna radiata var. radiata]
MQSGGPESASPVTHRVQSLSSADTRGKHRIHAELKRLEQEARFLEEALDIELEDARRMKSWKNLKGWRRRLQRAKDCSATWKQNLIHYYHQQLDP